MYEGLIDPVILFSTLLLVSFETREACDEFNKQQMYREDTECSITYRYSLKPPLPRPKILEQDTDVLDLFF
tara:strand:- start:279 stop:491 length:213 start_codon:yes stop_codon:yes gene_type:complete